MRAIVQRVKRGQVRVDEYVVGKAGKGLMVLVGFSMMMLIRLRV